MVTVQGLIGLKIYERLRDKSAEANPILWQRHTVNIRLFSRNPWFSWFFSYDSCIIPVCNGLIHVCY